MLDGQIHGRQALRPSRSTPHLRAWARGLAQADAHVLHGVVVVRRCPVQVTVRSNFPWQTNRWAACGPNPTHIVDVMATDMSGFTG